MSTYVAVQHHRQVVTVPAIRIDLARLYHVLARASLSALFIIGCAVVIWAYLGVSNEPLVAAHATLVP